jgi:hypothetical protein
MRCGDMRHVFQILRKAMANARHTRIASARQCETELARSVRDGKFPRRSIALIAPNLVIGRDALSGMLKIKATYGYPQRLGSSVGRLTFGKALAIDEIRRSR